MTSEKDRRISILIVEDNPIYREALEGYLKAHPDRFEVVGWTNQPDAAVSLVEQHVPDIILLDLVLHRDRSAGTRVIHEVRRISPTTQIVVLTAYFDDDLVFNAIRAGATTYLIKDSITRDELVTALTRVRDGDPPMDPQIARRLYEFFQSPDAGPDPSSPPLTRREWEVLKLVAEGMRNREIAEKLVITEKTVKTHVSNILSKLHLSNRTELQWWYRRRHFAGEGGADVPGK